MIGILSTKELQVEGVAFAIQSKFIHSAIAELKKEEEHHAITLSAKSKISSLNHMQQVKKIADYVYMIRSY